MARNKTIKINANREGFSEARTFVEGVLEKARVSDAMASETMLLFEALFNKIISQVDDEDTEVEISTVNGLGRTDVKMVFAGKRFSLQGGDVSADPDAKTIEEFSEKISSSYLGGDNVIRVSVNKTAQSYLLPNLIAIIAAIVVSFVVALLVDEKDCQQVVNEWIAPLEKLFTNAMLMIGAPMTLFSLLKNVTDAFIVAKRHSSPRRLFITAVSSSAAAIALALIMGFVFAQYILSATGVTLTSGLPIGRFLRE